MIAKYLIFCLVAFIAVMIGIMVYKVKRLGLFIPTVITVPNYIKTNANLSYIQNEINQFYAMEDRYPYSLKELEDWRGEALYKLPKGYAYSYDKDTGKLDVVSLQP